MIYNQPLVSIRCLVYNHEPYLRQCLDGFVMQKTSFAFEAIVHDDASTDGSAAIIREYAEKYPDIIKPIYEKENQYSKHDGSIRRIMNAAIHPAAKYIAMCEGDDYWIDPLKLQKQVDFLEANPEYGLVHTNYVALNNETKRISKIRRNCVDGKITKDLLLGRFYIATLTVCYRKDILKQIDDSYVREKFRMGDYPLWIEISRASEIKYISEVTSVYRILDESASHSNDKYKRIAFAADVRRIRMYFVEKYKYSDIRSDVYKEYMYFESLVCACKGYYWKSIVCLLKSELWSCRKLKSYIGVILH